MRRLCFAVLLLALMCVGAFAGAILVPAETDVKLLVALVDATDGYSPETEKKHGDTTVTYCDVTDGNTVSSYDDEGNWAEIGDGTGNYILTIGASEFDNPDHVYFVQVAVSGCRTVRLWVHTLYEPLGQLAQVDTAGKLISIDSNDLVQVVLHDVSASSGVGTVSDVYDRLATIVPADFNEVTVASNSVSAILADAAHGGESATLELSDYSDFQGVDLDEVYARIAPIVPADFNDVGITANNLHVHVKASDIVDPNADDVQEAVSTALALYGVSTLTPADVSVAVASGTVVAEGAVATAGTASTFTLSTDFQGAANAYVPGTLIMVQDADDNHWELRVIKSYTAARVVTLRSPLTFTPAKNDAVKVVPGYWLYVWY